MELIFSLSIIAALALAALVLTIVMIGKLFDACADIKQIRRTLDKLCK